MSEPILMPALSPTMEEGTLTKWLVKEGDKIAPGQVIAEIETDKATMDFEAVDEGVIEKILIPEGTEGVKVRTPIAQMVGGANPPPASKASGGGGRREAAPVGATSPPQTAPSVSLRSPASPQAGEHKNGAARVHASPLAKRMAEQAGIDITGLQGSGPAGRVVKSDVEAAMKAPQAAKAPAAVQQPAPQQARPNLPDAPKPPAPLLPYKEGEYTLEKMDGMRKAIARRMTQSFRDVPHFPLTIDVEIDKLLTARKQLNARLESQSVKLSVNDMLIRACALALIKVPASNVSFAGDAIMKHKHAHIAVAVAIEGGLVTPVIFYADQKGLSQISTEMKALAEKAHARKLLPQDYEGGTFTISNLGMMGIRNFNSILNEPQAMILSVGAGEQRPVVKDGALQIATVMSMTLTCDHRAVDGAIGAEYLNALRTFIEDPMMMMA
ncbi:MAG TPA: pyruvate dehydrogenase complex dihydrolipoamide acetyltransferase [Caulobacterales bacterium]|nr:pyruvate dehydrogenase complex dihydrolipoamide acetyltransferase [Caulobacterales bacterium]